MNQEVEPEEKVEDIESLKAVNELNEGIITKLRAELAEYKYRTTHSEGILEQIQKISQYYIVGIHTSKKEDPS